MKHLLIFLLLTLSLGARPLKVDVAAESAILINADSGLVLFEKKSHEPLYPASITKVATALYALEKKGDAALDELVVASRESIAAVSAAKKQALGSSEPPYRLELDGSHIGIRSQEALPFRSLLQGLLVASGNDAANVIAEYVSGSVPKFMEELGLYLRSHGIVETSFLNPHGLHHREHKTTAYDMALMTRLALRHPFFREIVRSTRAERPKTGHQESTQFVQTNKLLKPGQHFYPKAIGVKTGRTAAAGYTLVAAATHEGRTLIAVLLGCKEAAERYQDAIRLFEAAFSEPSIHRTFFSKGYDHFSRAVAGGKGSLKAALSQDLAVECYPSEEMDFTAELEWSPLTLPIREGEVVGHVELIAKTGSVIAKVPLLARASVEKTWGRFLLDGCKAHRTAILLTALGLNLVLALTYYLRRKDTA